MLPQVLTVFHDYEHIALGLIMIVFMIFLRAGHGAVAGAALLRRRRHERLAAEDLTHRFRRRAAVDSVSFAVKPGEIFAIIGPNGAGKTTLFNLIRASIRPRAAACLLDGDDVTGSAPHLLARRGLSRTFQNLQIFFRMSAAENVMVGRHLHERRNVLAHLFVLPSVVRQNNETRAEGGGIARAVGLAALADRPAGSLPYGALKRLEIARALATEPKVLLLDEPAAGCNAVETAEIDAMIQKIAAQGSQWCWSSTTCGW